MLISKSRLCKRTIFIADNDEERRQLQVRSGVPPRTSHGENEELVRMGHKWVV